MTGRRENYPDRRAAFTLVEIMVVVTIISILAMVSIPAFQRIQRRAKTTTVANDFRVFAGAFESYAAETGSFPADSAVGVVPPLMAGRINTANFTRVTPMGGKYNYEGNQLHFGVRYKAALTISTAPGATLVMDIPQLTDLENTIDKGSFNWLGGSFHLGTGIQPLYIISD
jgi:prepilin-type N-terminal cleavage/methylation domain-containing protein